MIGRRLRLVSLGAVFVGGGLTLLAVTQPWITVRLVPGAAGAGDIAVQGSDAAPTVATLALACLALVAAIALTGSLVRTILGVIGGLLGIGVLAASVPALLDPVAAASSSITSATGVAGHDALAELIATTALTGWGFAAVAGGAIAVLAGGLVATTARRWPGASHRYETAHARTTDIPSTPADVDGRRRDQAIDDWDTLSRGDDPTR